MIDVMCPLVRGGTAAIAGELRAGTTAKIREALRALLGPGETQAPADERTLDRARKILNFFAQPFYVAEPYTHRPGVTVPLAEALRVCREILDGVYDDVPTAAFYFTGGLDEILARAARQ